ncbi:MAG: lipase family protein, partial [Gammaproteobacteria bacterium]|nr:lipase family protein [Gammaproteobacteria bacterium]
MSASVFAEEKQSDTEDANLFVELLHYARLANAAYGNRATIEKETAAQGYKLSYLNNLPTLQVSYYLATDDNNQTQTIVVRGTSNVENALVDIAFQLINSKDFGIQLHNGFAVSAAGIYQDIKPHLNKQYKIRTTGHSLGGAVAVILALYLKNDGYQLERVVTFGQPKVTNITGSRKLDPLNLWRVVTPRDLVPLVPPLHMADINSLNIYWHAGREIILLPGKQYTITSGIESMLRATKFLAEPLNEK